MSDAWPLDGALDPRVRFPAGEVAWAAPARVLVTGATGLLGAFVLAEILRTSGADAACLVRPTTGQEAAARLRAHLEALGLWVPGYAERIRMVEGDLGSPRLGLTADAFDALAGSVDAIHHCGATTHFLRPYAELRAVNVLGTTELLRLAASGRPKAMHHVSTLAVYFDRPGVEGETIREDDPPSPDGIRSGYVRSKWVAERRVLEAMGRGLPAVVYRTGRITGDSRTGATSHPDDLLSSLLRACVGLGAVPTLDVEVPMLPVDFVARAIVHLSRDPGSRGRALHLFQPAPASWAEITAMIAAAGYPLKETSLSAWRVRLKQAARGDGPNRELYARLWLLVGPDSAFLGGRPRYPTSAGADALSRAGITCPAVDQPLLRRYLAYFRERGYLPPPSNE